MPKPRELVSLSRDTGYPLGTLEVVTRLLDLLQAIARDPRLGERVALTGGTALNAFHSGWPRLSMDIDLNYIGPLDEGTMLIKRGPIPTYAQPGRITCPDECAMRRKAGQDRKSYARLMDRVRRVRESDA